MTRPLTADARAALVARLASAGFVAAEEEADELLACGGDLEPLVARRLTGEPLAWITGSVRFCGLDLEVHPGVYVPRWQSEALARRAAARLPTKGTAIDVCTGCGAIAAVLRAAHPAARVVATDADPRAVACAIVNGVDARLGDLFGPLTPVEADVVVAVVPYVPTSELALLQRDTLAFESPRSYDGGQDGLGILRRVVAASPQFLRRGSALLLELGGAQAEALRVDLRASGFGAIEVIVDEDGDIRGVEATLATAR